MKMSNRNILTYTGRLFDFREPTPDMICIEDIAHALALTNRFNGHTYQPYSVAEHCERMSYPELPGDPLSNLLHECAEAYVGDISSPQKGCLIWEWPGPGHVTQTTFRDQEEYILKIIYGALGILPRLPADTKKADHIMLATEIRDLMPKTTAFDSWLDGAKPLEAKIYPLSWELAEDQFLARFEELKEGLTNG